jgi:ribosome-binding protein aMBF1 (putative translation factor)
VRKKKNEIKKYHRGEKLNKNCSICGKDLSKWNLDFTRDIVCDSCASGVGGQDGTKDKLSKEYTEISAVKKLYDAIIKKKITSAQAIQCLEKVTGYEFTSTKDFRNKMEKFLNKHYYRGADLRNARKWSGMERSNLADWFGVSTHTIKQMEINKKPLSQDAIDFIVVMGFQKKVPLKKNKKRASEYNCIQTIKNDKIPSEKKLQNSQVSDTIKCEVCNEWKERWEVTIECINPYRTQFICEDCLLEKRKIEDKKR